MAGSTGWCPVGVLVGGGLLWCGCCGLGFWRTVGFGCNRAVALLWCGWVCCDCCRHWCIMVVVWLVLFGCCCCNCIVDASIFIRKSSMHLPARCVGGCVACDCLYLCVNDRCPALLWGVVVVFAHIVAYAAGAVICLVVVLVG